MCPLCKNYARTSLDLESKEYHHPNCVLAPSPGRSGPFRLTQPFDDPYHVDLMRDQQIINTANDVRGALEKHLLLCVGDGGEYTVQIGPYVVHSNGVTVRGVVLRASLGMVNVGDCVTEHALMVDPRFTPCTLQAHPAVWSGILNGVLHTYVYETTDLTSAEQVTYCRRIS